MHIPHKLRKVSKQGEYILSLRKSFAVLGTLEEFQCKKTSMEWSNILKQVTEPFKMFMQ